MPLQQDIVDLSSVRESCQRDGGFTLIEVMLVIVIMAVMTAMVAPSFFSASAPSLNDQARRLSQALRLAVDETALSGTPIRWTAYRHSYVFESLDGEGAWQARHDSPYQTYTLPKGIVIAAVDPARLPTTQQKDDTSRPNDSKKEPVMSHLIIPPQGVMEASDITLATEADETSALHILIRPGPGGIRIANQDSP